MKTFLLHPQLAQCTVNVGVSACLLGHRVRYDGQTKSITLLLNKINMKTQWHPLCPEITFGIPRPPVQLIKLDGKDSVQAIGVKNLDLNITEALNQNSLHILNSDWDETTETADDMNFQLLAMANGKKKSGITPYKDTMDIWLLKARSPSCGSQTTPLHNTNGEVLSLTDGLFTQACRVLSPLCAIFDESTLNNTKMRNIFCLCAFVTLDIKNTTEKQLPKLVAHYQGHDLLPKRNLQLDRFELCKALHNSIRGSSEEKINELMSDLYG